MAEYLGPETKKAKKNFTATGVPFSLHLAYSIVRVKIAAAQANIFTKKLQRKKGRAILLAAKEFLDGKYDDHIVVDAIQGGAGTSMNMNINELLARRASVIIGTPQSVHPNDDVNMSQSTNDVVPTAMRIALAEQTDDILEALCVYESALLAKAKEFKDVLKVGRTHLQDALPMSLGQEFAAHARAVKKDVERIKKAQKGLFEINLGGTAIGTGLNANKKYANHALDRLKKDTKLPLKRSTDLVYATQYCDALVEISSVLSIAATSIMKCMHDLRLLASGPRTGYGEISFKKVQAGSSIMPGKVNPVMTEYLNQIAIQVIGNHSAVLMSAQAGQLELNVMAPVLFKNISESLQLLTDGLVQCAERGINNVTAHEDVCRKHLENSFAFLTALAPEIGYDRATRIAEKARRTDMSLKEVLVEENILSEDEYEKRISSPSLITLS